MLILYSLAVGSTLYTPTVFECDYYYNDYFTGNIIGSMWAVLATSSDVIDGWRSSDNIYTYVPYFAWDKTDQDGGSIILNKSVIKDEIISSSSYTGLTVGAEGKQYFDDFNHETRIPGNAVHFYRFSRINISTITGTILLNSFDGLLNDETCFYCATIGNAYLRGTDTYTITEAIAVRNAFNTKINITDYNTYESSGYKYTVIEPWSGRVVDTLPTIEDASYRYVLEGQTCYYNNMLLTCFGDSWYDAMGNVVT